MRLLQIQKSSNFELFLFCSLLTWFEPLLSVMLYRTSTIRYNKIMKLQFFNKFRAVDTPFSDVDLAKARLLQYMTARNKWGVKSHKRLEQYEKKFGKITGSTKAFELARQELQPIMDEFYTARDHGRYLPGKALSDPPEYDPNDEKVVDVMQKSPKRIEIKTERIKYPKPGLNYQYVLLKQNDEWRLDSRKVFFKFKGKWTSVAL